MLILLFAVLSVLVLWNPPNVKFHKFAVLLIVLLEALRVNSGTDYLLYKGIFIDKFLPENYVEPFYYLLSYFFSVSVPYFHFFLFVVSSICWYFFSKGLSNFTNFNALGLLFLFVILVGFLGANRQMLALAICFWAVCYLQKEKWYIYILLVILASGFHVSALIMLPAVLLKNRIGNNKWMLIGIIVIMLSVSKTLLFFLQFMSDSHLLHPYFDWKLNQYLVENNKLSINWVNILGFLRKLLPLVLLIVHKKQLKENKYFNIIFNFCMASLLLYIVALFNFIPLLGRLTIYYSIFEAVVYSWVGYINLKSKYQNLVLENLIFLGLIFFFKSISTYPELFIPYQILFFKF